MQIPQNWTFENDAIAQAFDQHVREQLPWYDLATGAVSHIARHYIPEGGLIYDIGASTGNIARALEPMLIERHADIIPIEASQEMAIQYHGPGAENLVVEDASTYDFDRCDLAVCFLTMMFMPVAKRAIWLADLRCRLKPGGAIILFDKCEATTGYAATVLWRLTLAGKMAAGVDPAEIIAKELSLGGVQRPLNPSEIPDDALSWMRFGEFCGWIIEAKP